MTCSAHTPMQGANGSTFCVMCGVTLTPPATADTEQYGGDHYKTAPIQPWAVIDTWPLEQRIGFYRGNALKYTMRLHKKDTPIDNIEKAAHYCRKLAEVLREPQV